MTNADIKRAAQRVAADILEELSHGSHPSGEGAFQGSAHRKLPRELRNKFIAVRSALFERGVFDPVLARFDTATASQADTRTLAERLTAAADAL